MVRKLRQGHGIAIALDHPEPVPVKRDIEIGVGSDIAEFPDLERAIQDAKASIREIVADHAGEGWFVDMSKCFILIRDGDGSGARVFYADAFEKPA